MNKRAFCIADHPRQQKWRFLDFTISLTNTLYANYPRCGERNPPFAVQSSCRPHMHPQQMRESSRPARASVYLPQVSFGGCLCPLDSCCAKYCLYAGKFQPDCCQGFDNAFVLVGTGTHFHTHAEIREDECPEGGRTGFERMRADFNLATR